MTSILFACSLYKNVQSLINRSCCGNTWPTQINKSRTVDNWWYITS